MRDSVVVYGSSNNWVNSVRRAISDVNKMQLRCINAAKNAPNGTLGIIEMMEAYDQMCVAYSPDIFRPLILKDSAWFGTLFSRMTNFTSRVLDDHVVPEATDGHDVTGWMLLSTLIAMVANYVYDVVTTRHQEVLKVSDRAKAAFEGTESDHFEVAWKNAKDDKHLIANSSAKVLGVLLRRAVHNATEATSVSIGFIGFEIKYNKLWTNAQIGSDSSLQTVQECMFNIFENLLSFTHPIKWRNRPALQKIVFPHMRISSKNILHTDLVSRGALQDDSGGSVS